MVCWGIRRPQSSIEFGCRQFNRAHEEEANWLGPALLISEEAALYIVEQRLTVDWAGLDYGVSRDLITMRISVTGAQRRMQRRWARAGTN